MRQKHRLFNKYWELYAERSLTVEDFNTALKALLKESLEELKKEAHPDLDFVIGSISLSEGDKYNIPVKNAVNHFIRAYKNGSASAGIMYARILEGAFPQIPADYVDKEKARRLYEEEAGKGNPHWQYAYSMFLINEIMYTNEGGGYVPEEWFQQSYKMAVEAADAGYIGGHNILGLMHLNGFGSFIQPNAKESFIHYQKAIEGYDGDLEIESYYAEALFNVGAAYFDGQGAHRDRRKGVELIKQAVERGSLIAHDWLSQSYPYLEKEGLLSESDDLSYDVSFDDADLVQLDPVLPAAPKTRSDVTRH